MGVVERKRECVRQSAGLSGERATALSFANVVYHWYLYGLLVGRVSPGLIGVTFVVFVGDPGTITSSRSNLSPVTGDMM